MPSSVVVVPSSFDEELYVVREYVLRVKLILVAVFDLSRMPACCIRHDLKSCAPHLENILQMPVQSKFSAVLATASPFDGDGEQ